MVNSGTINVDGDLGRLRRGDFALRGRRSRTTARSISATTSTRLAGPVSGTGDFSLSAGSTLKFGSSVSSGETATFASSVDKLILDSPSSFDGTIDDFFTKGDAVIAKGFDESATTLLYTQTGADSCSWTLTDGANTAVLNFAGEPYTQSDFSIAPANGGAGSAIKFV